MRTWKEAYPIGKKLVVPVEVPDGEGDIRLDWATAQVVNFWENRIGHDAGLIVKHDGGNQWISFSFLNEDGAGFGIPVQE